MVLGPNISFAEDVYTEKSEEVSYYWGAGGPDGLKDNFKAIFDQSQTLSKGDYFVQTLADDGVVMDINGHTVISRENYSSKSLINRHLLTEVSDGNYDIKTTYYEGTGNARVFSHVVPFGNWLAYYYPNQSHSGTPVASELLDSNMNNQLNDSFSSRMIPYVNLKGFSSTYVTAERLNAGKYVIRTGTGSDLQVFVDGKQISKGIDTKNKGNSVVVNIKDRDTASNGQKNVHWIEIKGKGLTSSSKVDVEIVPYNEIMNIQVSNGWVGEVFTAKNFKGQSIILGDNATSLSDELNLDWKKGSPDPSIPNDYFSAQFYSKKQVKETGFYKLKIWADDKVRLYIDGEKVVDSWKYVRGSYREVVVPLEKGIHNLKLEYEEAVLNARIQFIMEDVQADFSEKTTTVEYNWGQSGPNNITDNFTAQFDQSQYLDAGDYFMQTRADDGLLVEVDSNKVIDRWNYSSNTIDRVLLPNLKAGNHSINLLYNEGKYAANIFSNVVGFGDWLAYYYNNDSYSGPPAATKVIESNSKDDLIETNWQSSPVPGKVAKDNFTASYVTAKRIPAGEYVINLGADDGAEVFIDGESVLERYKPVGYREDSVKVTIKDQDDTGDIHWIEVKYEEGVLSSRVNFSMRPYSQFTDIGPEDGWIGELFPNKDLTGRPVILGSNLFGNPINKLDYWWGDEAPSPLLPKDNFSSRFTRKYDITEPGYYVFNAWADDGVKVFVDNKKVIDSWNYEKDHLRQHGMYLDAGVHTIQVEHYDGKYSSRLAFELNKGKDYYNATEKSVFRNWGTGSPSVEVQPDHFTATFDQSQILSSGDHFIQTLADDGLTVDFDNKTIINRPKYSSESIIDRATITDVGYGKHKITTNYVEGTGNAVILSDIVEFGDWLAYYYPNKTLSGTPVASKVIDSQGKYGGLLENNGVNSPVPGIVPEDYFSASYVTAKRITEGEYVLRTGADDGVQVYIDGELVLDRFTNGGFREDSIKLTITDNEKASVNKKDIHWIEVKYKENSQSSKVQAFLQPYSEANNLSVSDGWIAEFYKNTNLTGDPVIMGGKDAIKPLQAIDFEWGQGSASPLLPSDEFSARIKREINVNNPGYFAFDVTADDGVRIKLKNNKTGKTETIIDSWHYVSGSKRVPVDHYIEEGQYTIIIEYYEGKLGAKLLFSMPRVTATNYQEIDLRIPSNITAKDIQNFFARKSPGNILGKYAQEFINVQNKTGVNAQYLVAHAIWETGWGQSKISEYKNNLYGYGAYDSCPFECAYYFPTVEEGMYFVAYKVKSNYLTPNGPYYNGPTLPGMNVRYATDKNWKNGISNLMSQIKPFDSVYYKNAVPDKRTPVKPPEYGRDIPSGTPSLVVFIEFPEGTKGSVNVTEGTLSLRDKPTTNSTVLKSLSNNKQLTIKGYNTGDSEWYKVSVDGTEGWVSKKYVSVSNLLQVDISSGSLNVRSNPSIGSDDIGDLPKDVYVQAILDSSGKPKMQNGWYNIVIPNSKNTGWVSGDYMKEIK